MRRYARVIATIWCGHEMVQSWMVIRTDEVPHHEVIAAGFEEVLSTLTDEEVKFKYGVKEIVTVTDVTRMSEVN